AALGQVSLGRRQRRAAVPRLRGHNHGGRVLSERRRESPRHAEATVSGRPNCPRSRMKRTTKRAAKKRDALRYLVLIRRTATGYGGEVPDLPGCVAAARTLNAARRLIAEAIGLHLELMRRSGEPVPAPSRSIEFTVDETSEEELCTW